MIFTLIIGSLFPGFRTFVLIVAMMCIAMGLGAKPADADTLIVDAVYTGDIWNVPSGGLKHGTRYLDNIDLTATLDTGALGGADGSSVFIYMLANNASTVSDTLVGDVHAISNIEASSAVRLFEAWYEHPLAGGAGSIKLGLFDLNSEFDAIDTASLFINSSHGIGIDFSQSGLNGPSIFPTTSLAARVQWQVADTVLLRAAVLDGVPGDPAHSKRTTIKLGNGDGALIVAEAEANIAGTIAAVGAWHYTAAYDHLTETDGLTGLPLRTSNNRGIYFEAERRVYAPSPDSDAGLNVFGRFGLAESSINPIGSYLGFGATYRGLMATRRDDELGFAVASAHNGGHYRLAQDRAGIQVDEREVNFELTYRAAITPWLHLQPDVQYIINPSMDPGVKNALALGLRFEISGSWAR